MFWGSQRLSETSWHLIGLITKALLIKPLLVDSRASYKFTGNNNSKNNYINNNHRYKMTLLLPLGMTTKRMARTTSKGTNPTSS